MPLDLLQQLIVDGPVAVLRFRADDLYLDYVSPNAARVLATDAVVVGETLSELLHPDDAAALERFVPDLLDGTAPEARLDVRCHDGERWRWSHMIARAEQRDGAAGAPRRIVAYAHDVTARHEAEADLERFFDLSLDLLAVATLDGYLDVMNAAWEHALGYSRETIRSKPFLDFVHPADLEATQAAFARLLDGETVRGFENRYRRADGTYLWLQWSSVLDPDLGRVFAVARDVTEQRRIQEELRAAREAAQRANEAKSEFLSRMSHELRTPLNSILGFAQLLDMSELEARDSDCVEQIEHGGRHLLALIDEVLDIARIETGHVHLSLEPVDLGVVLHEALDLVRPLAAEHGVTLHLAPLRPATVHADRQRLAQVALNLLSNAIKYNHSGGSVRVECDTLEGTARVRVADTGVGLGPDQLERLFTPFDRLGAERSGIEGTGLGLALSQRLVKAMGGDLRLDSTLGAGTTALLDLPLASEAVHEAHDAALAATATVPAGRRHTVLYVEDNLANLQLIERVLDRRPGTQLISAMQGSLGLELAEQHHPDVILLDVHLPDIDGGVVLDRLKAGPGTAGIPVVVISADATAKQQQRLIEAGAVAYLTKPIDIRRFLEVLDRLLDGSEESA